MNKDKIYIHLIYIMFYCEGYARGYGKLDKKYLFNLRGEGSSIIKIT